MPTGTITFSRNCLLDTEIPDFEKSDKKFGKIVLQPKGTIEDCFGALQMDFANKYLGGGVLYSGCVQEEIRFMICPELIVGLLFTEEMMPNESVIIKGCEQFSSYTGYARSFAFGGDFVDNAPRDKWKRLYNHVLAIDAISYHDKKSQFEEKNVHRELVKCISGFKSDNKNRKNSENSSPKQAAIATGNWGCGAFGGDVELKFLIQMMAAAETDRDLIYYTFHDEETMKKLELIVKLLANLNVSQAYELIKEYSNEVGHLKISEMKRFGLGQFLMTKFIHIF